MKRRSQAQRSAETQAALLDATIDCLVARGFEGTSTPEICRRAGVSRGAQLHHYPTKVDLLVAAVEHLCHARVQEFQRMVETRPSDSQRLDAAFEQLWKVYSSDTLKAWIELAVASRSDPVLNAHMREVSLRLEEEVESAMRTLFGIDDEVSTRATVRLVLSLLDGLAFRSILQDEAAARQALVVFRKLIEPLLEQGER